MAEGVAFRSLRVDELKKYLTDRGIPCHGKRKEELVHLAENSLDKYEVIEKCDHDESERKRRRVEEEDGSVTDLNDAEVSWTNDLGKMPALTLGDVFAYLVRNCLWTPERMSKFQKDDGYLMFKDEHIENVKLGSIHHDHNAVYMYITGTVKPEQRQSAQRYDTWVLLKTDGDIKSAGCGCVAADDGSCKHVIALLFAVEDFVRRRTDDGTAVGTDRACQWSKPRRSSLPVKIEDLDYRHDKKTPKKPGPIPKNYTPLREICEQDIVNVQQHLKKVCEQTHPGALFLKLVKTPEPIRTVPTIEMLYQTFKLSPTTLTFEDFVGMVTTADHLETLRALDQSDPAWMDARKGRITASIADQVRSLRDYSNSKTLVARIMGTANCVISKFTEFGKTNEPVARRLYTLQEDHHHKNLTVDECGLFCLQESPYIGASPDGIVSCACHERKLLEVKCSFKHKDILPEQIPQEDSRYHLQVTNETLTLKKSSAWYSQVQFQMGVTGIQMCDLVLYTRKGICIIHIPFDDERWELLLCKSIDFFKKVIVPLLHVQTEE